MACAAASDDSSAPSVSIVLKSRTIPFVRYIVVRKVQTTDTALHVETGDYSARPPVHELTAEGRLQARDVAAHIHDEAVRGTPSLRRVGIDVLRSHATIVAADAESESSAEAIYEASMHFVSPTKGFESVELNPLERGIDLLGLGAPRTAESSKPIRDRLFQNAFKTVLRAFKANGPRAFETAESVCAHTIVVVASTPTYLHILADVLDLDTRGATVKALRPALGALTMFDVTPFVDGVHDEDVAPSFEVHVHEIMAIGKSVHATKPTLVWNNAA